jgi:hypothetical protein
VITVLECEVLEACLLGVPIGRAKAKVRAVDIRNRLRRSNPAYEALSVNKTAAAIRSVFPVYKNRRARTRHFKVCRSAAEHYRVVNAIALRPLEDARQCRIGRAVEMEWQLRDISPSGSVRRRRKWEESTEHLGWHRVLVRIDDVDQDQLRLYVPQWDPEETVCIPLDSLPDDLQQNVKTGQWILAAAQMQAQNPSYLRLRDFEPSPEPDPNDGLA